jgi:hypothetical protein
MFAMIDPHMPINVQERHPLRIHPLRIHPLRIHPLRIFTDPLFGHFHHQFAGASLSYQIFQFPPDRLHFGHPIQAHYMSFDERGNRKKTTDCKDRKTAQEVANKIELDADLRKRGHIDSKAERYAKEARRPIGEHLADFRAFLADKENTGKHVRMTCKHVATISETCKSERIGNTSGGK